MTRQVSKEYQKVKQLEMEPSSSEPYDDYLTSWHLDHSLQETQSQGPS